MRYHDDDLLTDPTTQRILFSSTFLKKGKKKDNYRVTIQECRHAETLDLGVKR